MLSGEATYTNFTIFDLKTKTTFSLSSKKFEDTNGGIRNRKSKQDRHYFDMKKKDKGAHNDIPNTSQKNKDRAK
jgi:hypothetical protein